MLVNHSDHCSTQLHYGFLQGAAVLQRLVPPLLIVQQVFYSFLKRF